MEERIAHFADIDTRRAMGFGPRKLVMPDLKLPKFSMRYYNIPTAVFDLVDACLYINEHEILWQFGNRYYEFRRRDCLIREYNCKVKPYWHPDFNKDGTFKRTKPKLNYGRAHSTLC